MLTFAEILNRINHTFNACGLDLDAMVASLGQTAACERRRRGEAFTLRDHVRGLVLAQLSNQRPWRPVAERLSEIDCLFQQFDPEFLKQANPRVLEEGLLALRCGNRSLRRQMASLAGNIAVMEAIAHEFGSLDHFVTSDTPETVASRLASPGPYKLANIGFTLAQEYLKNVGIESVKPDLHVIRIMGPTRLGLISQESPEAAYREIMRRAAEIKRSPTYVDNVLWLFGAKDYGSICGASPRCEVCHLKSFCHIQ